MFDLVLFAVVCKHVISRLLLVPSIFLRGPLALLLIASISADDSPVFSSLSSTYKTAVAEIEAGNFQASKKHLLAVIDAAPVFIAEPHYVLLTAVFPHEFRSAGKSGLAMEAFERSAHAVAAFLEASEAANGGYSNMPTSGSYGNGGEEVANVVMAHYALAHYHRVLQNTSVAWEHFLAGAHAKHSGTPGAESHSEQEIMALRMLPLAFPRTVLQLFAKKLAPGPALAEIQPAPVLIIGLPRSGSTLLEQVLARHSEVVPGGEAPVSLANKVMEPALLSILKEAPQLSARRLQRGDDLYAESLVTSLSEKQVNALRREALLYARAMQKKAMELGATSGTKYITDKTLNNFMQLGLLSGMLPHARIVYCERSPLDIGLSLFWHMFPGNAHMYSYDMRSLGKYVALAQMAIEQLRSALSPSRVHTVVYEEFVRDMAGNTRELLKFLDLKWEDSVLEFTSPKTVKTASLYQVRRPLYNSSVGQWRRHKRWLAPLRKGLQEGYEQARRDAEAVGVVLQDVDKDVSIRRRRRTRARAAKSEDVGGARLESAKAKAQSAAVRLKAAEEALTAAQNEREEAARAAATAQSELAELSEMREDHV